MPSMRLYSLSYLADRNITMLKELLSAIMSPFQWVYHRISGWRNWCRNPKMDNGKWLIPPLLQWSHRQRIANRKESFILVVLYNGFVGLLSFARSELWGRFVYLVTALSGALRDLSGDGYRYAVPFVVWCWNRFWVSLKWFGRITKKLIVRVR